MIEFKRAGDVMVFACPAFKIEICADAERIEFADTLHDPIDRVTEAFKVLDMMLEHKARQSRIYTIAESEITFDVKNTEQGKSANETHINIDLKELLRKVNSEAINKMRDRGVN